MNGPSQTARGRSRAVIGTRDEWPVGGDIEWETMAA